MPALHYVSRIDEFSWVITSLLAVFKQVLFMIVSRDSPVHYYVLYAIQKVHFTITLVSLWHSFRLFPEWTL